MSTDRDTTRIVRSWLRSNEHESADRVLDFVLEAIDTTPQRRAMPWPARRFPEMNTMAKLGFAAAAVVILAAVGFSVLRGGGSGIGDSPGPTPTPTAEPSASPTAAATPEGLLPEGPHVLSGGEADGMPSRRMTVTIPAPDWYGEPGGGILQKNESSDAPDGAGLIVFGGDLYVYGDPCEWSTTRPDTPATTVDELVAALTAQASRDASTPIDVTVGGYPGKSITLHVPDDAVFSRCDQGTFGSWGVPGSDPRPHRYHQDPGQIDKLWIVDVEGETVVIDTGYYEATPQSVIDELEAIVASTTFE